MVDIASPRTMLPEVLQKHLISRLFSSTIPLKKATRRNKKLLTEVIHLLDLPGEHRKLLLMFHHFQNEDYLCHQKLQSQIRVSNPSQQKQIQQKQLKQNSIPFIKILIGRRKSNMNVPVMALYLGII